MHIICLTLMTYSFRSMVFHIDWVVITKPNRGNLSLLHILWTCHIDMVDYCLTVFSHSSWFLNHLLKSQGDFRVIVSVGLSVCMFIYLFVCPSIFSKTPLPTFMKLYIMLSYALVWKPIEFCVDWSTLIN